MNNPSADTKFPSPFLSSIEFANSKSNDDTENYDQFKLDYLACCIRIINKYYLLARKQPSRHNVLSAPDIQSIILEKIRLIRNENRDQRFVSESDIKALIQDIRDIFVAKSDTVVALEKHPAACQRKP